jgi:hypothetical protein
MIEKLKELLEDKKQTINKLREVESSINYLEKEKLYLEENVKKAQELKVLEIRNKLKKLEFKLVTSAKDARLERKYLNKIKELEQKLKEYEPYFYALKRYKQVLPQIDALKAQKEELQSKLELLEKQIKELSRKVRKNGAKVDKPDKEYTTLEDLLEPK